MTISSRFPGSICGAILSKRLSLRGSAATPSAARALRAPVSSAAAPVTRFRGCLCTKRGGRGNPRDFHPVRGQPAKRFLSSSIGSAWPSAVLTRIVRRTRYLHDGFFFQLSRSPAAAKHSSVAATAAPRHHHHHHGHHHHAEPPDESRPPPRAPESNPTPVAQRSPNPHHPAHPHAKTHNHQHRDPHAPEEAAAYPALPVRSKKELIDMLDSYDGDSVEDHLQYFRDPFMRRYAPPDGPRLTVSDDQGEKERPTYDDIMDKVDQEEQRILWRLRFAVMTRARNPRKINLDSIYATYQQLPEPRMSYVYGRLRQQLLRVLGQPERRNSKSMLRYFSVIADIKNLGIPLTTGQWNGAISLASRYVGTTTKAELDGALELWREMELDAGVPANEVTFNILFDVASKAGAFDLAERIFAEMEGRGHQFNRYHHVSLIHFFGLKLDTGGVRAAYCEMVGAGQIIDTLVLNCVLAGFLRSGEEDAADRLYERMKSASPYASALPAARAPMTNRAITLALMMFARFQRSHPAMGPFLQGAAPLHPDLATYRILLNYHGVRLGNLARVAGFLDEMKVFRIPLHGAVFLALFKSFQKHGGYPNTPWSEKRLRGTWQAFIQALDSGQNEGLEISTWLAGWILRAFARCSTRQSVLDAYDVLKGRWRLDFAAEQFMIDLLTRVVPKR